MKNTCVVFSVLVLALSMGFVSCRQSDKRFSGYRSTPEGLYYRFYQQDKSKSQVKKTDFIKMKVACYLNDSLYYDWKESEGIIHAQVSDSRFAGDIQSAFVMMREGDSASFYIKADSIASVYYNQDPVALGLKGDDYFRYEIKLQKVMSSADYQKGLSNMETAMGNASKEVLKSYVLENGIDVLPTESGIYLIPIKKGEGRCPKKREKVFIDYKVSLLSGEELGSTYGDPERFSFVLGEGHVISGLEEILPMMHLKEVVRAIVPFDKAYKEREVGPIKPFSNLIYDIELQKIETVQEQAVEAERARKEQKERSDKDFAAFCKENSIVNHTASGLYYRIENKGNGQCPSDGSTARVVFEARVMNGDLLGTTEQLGDYYDIAMGEGKVLRGLEEGVGLMKVGEKALLVLPYYLAYGDRVYGNIPAYSNVVFEVELIEIL